ncbi:sel1 repeat family protein [Bradyrhizobium sp. STM 3809]|uniref:sel1 repeat family protein n=1 Tax=Bradyrhizobium sp. STM 3809 TaxID=551936 RepID=UPI000240988F|nr:sel1 repeat family protein [Bradyrhizobium sp. STM 3809]CCE01865.1 conserved exported hypothetical protein [Bradyrhizobium sp. STM 3809]
MLTSKLLAFVLSIGLSLPLALGQSLPNSETGPEQRVPALEAAWPDWLPKPAHQCPADLMPRHRADALDFSIARCSRAFDGCVGSCRSGAAGDCYGAAIVAQRVANGQLAQALFLQACTLGVTSGCTNRAAELDTIDDGNACAIRTYKMACDRDDPWACSMIGFHLIRGTGVAKDPARARKLLSKSCKYGPEDQACQVGRSLLKEVEH